MPRVCICYSNIWPTWQIPPFFLSNLVQIMCDVLKCSCQIALHSKLNCIFSVVSFSTLDVGLSSPVLPHPATTQLTCARTLSSFFGSAMGLTYLFSTAARFSWEQRTWLKTPQHHQQDLFVRREHTLVKRSAVYLQQHNIIVEASAVLWIWNKPGHLDPLLAVLFFTDVVSSKYHCHSSADKSEQRATVGRLAEILMLLFCGIISLFAVSSG